MTQNNETVGQEFAFHIADTDCKKHTCYDCIYRYEPLDILPCCNCQLDADLNTLCYFQKQDDSASPDQAELHRLADIGRFVEGLPEYYELKCESMSDGTKHIALCYFDDGRTCLFAHSLPELIAKARAEGIIGTGGGTE